MGAECIQNCIMKEYLELPRCGSHLTVDASSDTQKIPDEAAIVSRYTMEATTELDPSHPTHINVEPRNHVDSKVKRCLRRRTLMNYGQFDTCYEEESDCEQTVKVNTYELMTPMGNCCMLWSAVRNVNGTPSICGSCSSHFPTWYMYVRFDLLIR